jgi:DNA primase
MPIPEAKIKSVKASQSILDLCRAYGFTLEKKGEDYFAQCPFHDDKTASFSITPKKGLWHCLGACNTGGNIFQLVQKMEGVSFPKAFEKVAAQNGRDLALINPLHAEADALTLTRGHETPAPAARLQDTLESALGHMAAALDQSSEALTYLIETRGLTLQSKSLRETLPIGFCPPTFAERMDAAQRRVLQEAGLLSDAGRPHFAGCVVFPLRDEKGVLQGLYGRRIQGEGHVFLKGERKGVFGLHSGEADAVYLTESVIDALSLHQAGIPSVLALHGVNGFTAVHEAWLAAKGFRTVYLLLDGDAAGREASARLSLRLKGKGLVVHVLELPEGEDPNSFFSRPPGSGAPPRTLKDLTSLTGYPKGEKDAWERRWEGEELYLANGKREYRIRGLVGYGLDRMRVTVKCSLKGKPALFHLDSLDLYMAKARAHFVEEAAKILPAKPEIMDAEVKSLLGVLEEERLALRDTSSSKPAVYVMTEDEKQEALGALKDKRLIEHLLESYEALGMVGEEKAKLLGYLGSVSRLLPHPLGLLLVSRSGAGKTALQEAICDLLPEETIIRYTRLTGQALFYKEAGSLKHKVLSIEEEEGMRQALYSIRTLASSQRLTVATTRSDPKTGKMKTDEYQVEGPVFLLIATTNPEALDFETKSRFIVATVDESEAQTRRILSARKLRYTLEGQMQNQTREALLKKYRNMQRLLKPLAVVNPYAPYLDYPFDRLQMRREFGKYMTLISTIALLHQHQRELKTKTQGGKTLQYIEVTVEDIALANELALTFFPHGLDDMAPHTRSLAVEIAKLIKHKGGEVKFTRKELRDFCTWGDWPIRQGLEQLVELGYLGRNGQNGVLITYELLYDASSEERKKAFLTSPEELRQRLEAARRLEDEKPESKEKEEP